MSASSSKKHKTSSSSSSKKRAMTTRLGELSKDMYSSFVKMFRSNTLAAVNQRIQDAKESLLELEKEREAILLQDVRVMMRSNKKKETENKRLRELLGVNGIDPDEDEEAEEEAQD